LAGPRAAVDGAGPGAGPDGHDPLRLLPARDDAGQAGRALTRDRHPRRERHLHRERHPEGPRAARGGARGHAHPRGAGARHARGAGEDRPHARRGERHHDDPGGGRPGLNRLRVVAGVAISVALVVWLFRSVDLPELGRQLAATHWGWVVPAVAVGPLGLWARALRWRYLFPPRSEPPGLIPANMIGYMANNVLPLRAGELVRVYVAARHLRTERGMSAEQSLWLTGATVIVERVLDSL